jgi:hypothetical protein
MNRQLSKTFAAAALMLGTLSPFAHAQYNQAQFGQAPGASPYRQNISPYNLSVPGASAYPWVQQSFGTQFQNNVNNQLPMLQQQVGMNTAGLYGLQSDPYGLLGGLSGHTVTFLSYRTYFLNLNARAPMGYYGFGAGGYGMPGAGGGGYASGGYAGGGYNMAGGTGSATFNTVAPGMSSGLGNLGGGIGGAGRNSNTGGGRSNPFSPQVP